MMCENYSKKLSFFFFFSLKMEKAVLLVKMYISLINKGNMISSYMKLL